MEKRDAMTTSDLVKEMCQKHGISKSNDLSLTIILTHRGRKKTKSFLKVGKVEKMRQKWVGKIEKQLYNKVEKGVNLLYGGAKCWSVWQKERFRNGSKQEKTHLC